MTHIDIRGVSVGVGPCLSHIVEQSGTVVKHAIMEGDVETGEWLHSY